MSCHCPIPSEVFNAHTPVQRAWSAALFTLQFLQKPSMPIPVYREPHQQIYPSPIPLEFSMYIPLYRGPYKEIDLYCLTSQSCSSLDADDKLPTGWLLGGALPHRPSLCWVSVDPLGQNSFNEFPAGFFFYECNLPLEYSSLALSSGLQVPNWYFPPRWNYNSTNLLTFKFPEHKLDHCMCQSNSPSVLWSPFSLVLRWTVGILSFFHSGMGLTAHQLSLLRNSLLTIRFLTLFIPLTWGGGGKILLWSIVYFII